MRRGHSVGSFAAVLRPVLDETLSQEHDAEDLSPLRYDIAHHLAPFSLRIHVEKRSDPQRAGNEQENRQGMIAQNSLDAAGQNSARLLALGRASFVQMCGSQGHNDEAGPISDGIAEE